MKNLILGLILLVIQTSCCASKEVAKKAPVSEITKAETTKSVEPIIVEDEPKTVEILETESESETPKEMYNDENLPTTENVQVDYQAQETQEAFSHNAWSTLLYKHVTKQGNVDYKGFKNDRNDLKNYIFSLSQNMPNEAWTKEDKLAFWINAYNVMTVDLIVRNYPIKSIKDIKDPWEQRLWKLDNKWYNLEEIEHQILRKMDEPRIHFAIVCASYSCPKLLNEAYTSVNLEAQLTQSTKDFLSDSKRNNISQNSIEISKIFQWFSKDFKQNGDLIDFLNKYSDIQISTNTKKSYKDYNWDLNE